MTRNSRWLLCGSMATAACLTSTQLAMAHPGHVVPGDSAWFAGAMHPLMGLDHLLAMFASGLLAVRIGTRRALWIVPASFVVWMVLGGVLAFAGVPLPHAEWGIALSVIVLGLAVAVLPSVPLPVGVGLVGLFALFHGHAHVAELGGHAVLPYMTGFVLATMTLHAAAIAVGVLALKSRQPRFVRFAGAAIATSFAALLIFVS